LAQYFSHLSHASNSFLGGVSRNSRMVGISSVINLSIKFVQANKLKTSSPIERLSDKAFLTAIHQ
jgi:hypothetical protein